MVRTLLTLVFVAGLAPGGAEWVEDVGHVLSVEHHEAGQGEDPCNDNGCENDGCEDDGCTPGSHACPCCGALPGVVGAVSVEVPAFGPSRTLPLPFPDGAARPAHQRRLPRPPAA